jgi:hypothetical protein
MRRRESYKRNAAEMLSCDWRLSDEDYDHDIYNCIFDQVIRRSHDISVYEAFPIKESVQLIRRSQW